MKKMDFYYIDLKYVRDLSNIDDNVMSISPQRGKQDRPFVGVIILLNGQNYCIPLTSPKEKFLKMKSKVDFIKIFDSRKHGKGESKIIGVLNINNMIPVNNSVISKINLELKESDTQDMKNRKILMQKQLKWCRENVDTIINRANKVYDLVVNNADKNRNLVKRCSKFKKLEKIAERSRVRPC